MAVAVSVDENLAIRATNLALTKIGVSKTVASMSEATREAMTASILFPHEFKACLRQHPWPFATKYAALLVVANGGTSSAAVNGDWQYAYKYPTDCLFVRRVVEAGGSASTDQFGVVTSTRGSAGPVGREFSEVPGGPGIRSSPVVYRVGRLGDELVVFCSLTDDATTPTICIEYTAIFDCPEELVDELFMAALSWRLGAALAPSLSRLDKMATKAWQMYLHTIDTAAAVASREQQQPAHGDAEWIRARA